MSDAEIVDRFIVQRRTDHVDHHGRSVPQVASQHRAWGVVTPASPDDMQRVPDQEHMRKAVSIISRFRFHGPAPGQQPDHVVWHGDTYVVLTSDDYSAFGPGFTQALVQRIDATVSPPQVAT
jgi:hypothetical protein